MYLHLLSLCCCSTRRKIQRQEQVDEIIFKKLKDRDSEVDECLEIYNEIDQVEKRLLIEIKSLRNDIKRERMLEKYR